jgi:large subunit ribosomal protein L35
MPKMKTKSSVKKRFRVSASGKIRMKPSGMRHGMRKRSQSMKRKARKIGNIAKADEKILRPMMPTGGNDRRAQARWFSHSNGPLRGLADY